MGWVKPLPDGIKLMPGLQQRFSTLQAALECCLFLLMYPFILVVVCVNPFLALTLVRFLLLRLLSALPLAAPFPLLGEEAVW